MIYVDPPAWPARGRLWSHLVSDVSFAELHAFAELLGVPRRGFDRDHYDLPAELARVALWLGASPVASREIVRLLRAGGLRRPKHLAGLAARLAGPAAPFFDPASPVADPVLPQTGPLVGQLGSLAGQAGQLPGQVGPGRSLPALGEGG